MRTLLFIAALAILTSLSSFAQGNDPFRSVTNDSFANDGAEGIGYILLCPISIDANGAPSLSIGAGLQNFLQIYIKTPQGMVSTSAKLDGAMPSDWGKYVHPAYGTWMKTQDGRKYFRYNAAVPVTITREKVFNCPIRGVRFDDPQYQQYWITEYHVIL